MAKSPAGGGAAPAGGRGARGGAGGPGGLRAGGASGRDCRDRRRAARLAVAGDVGCAGDGHRLARAAADAGDHDGRHGAQIKSIVKTLVGVAAEVVHVELEGIRPRLLDELGVVQPATVGEAEIQLEEFCKIWDEKYPTISQSWRRHWENVIPFFDYPEDIRKVIYTTNAIESLNNVIWKAIKN